MNDPQKLELAILAIADNFEKFSDQFRVAFVSTEGRAHKWYTPRAMFLRVMRVAAHASEGSPEAQLALSAIHGSVDVLGFSGTVKLVLELWRKNAGKKQQAKSGLPGV